MLTAQEVIEAALVKRMLTQAEIAKKLELTPQAFGQKLLRNTLRANEFLEILEGLDIDVSYTVREDGKPLKFKSTGHGRRVQGTSNGIRFDTAASDAVSNSFYIDGENEYGEDGIAQELYVDRDGRYFLAEYVRDDPKKDKVHMIHANIAAAFIKEYGTEIEKGPRQNEEED